MAATVPDLRPAAPGSVGDDKAEAPTDLTGHDGNARMSGSQGHPVVPAFETQASTFSSSKPSGSDPPPSTTSWKSRSS